MHSSVKSIVILFWLCSSIISRGASLNVPGITPTEFSYNDKIEIHAIKLFSAKTQLPFDYYTVKQCEPKELVEYEPENIGSIIRGDRLVNTPFVVNMAVNSGCQVLCDVSYPAKKASKLHEFISSAYYAHLSADSLPCATRHISTSSRSPRFMYGYPLGFVDNDEVFVNNHLTFQMKYHKVGGDKYRLVGFEVVPASISQAEMNKLVDRKKQTCTIQNPLHTISSPQEIKSSEAAQDITFTYEVIWTESEILWASRWDIFLEADSTQIHWLSILNSLLIILLLSGIVAMILLRALRRDIAKYNRDEDAEDILEESGWKLIHGDVFRPPRFPRLLVVILGSGVQLFCMVFVVIFFSMLGMVSPASRGAIMTATIFTYVFMGVFAGYFAGRMYKTVKGDRWKGTAIFTGLFYPGLMFGLTFFLNTFLWGIGSSAGLPFGTIMAMLALWSLVSVPLVFVGFYFGFRKRPYDQPVRTNQIPRAVPAQPLKQNLLVASLMAGAMPFGAMSIELFFIMSAIWNRQVYYLFGFLFIVFLIYVVCCAEVAVVLTYFQLCNENYHWWWRSLIISGGPALYVFGYTIYYFLTQLTISGVIPTVVYFGHSLIMSVSTWILSATIGFYGVFFFLRKIYSAIKID